MPTNFIFDIERPEYTAMSLSGSLLSDITDNQQINQAITTAISQGTDISLNSVMQIMQTEDLAQVFDIPTEKAQIIKDFMNNNSSMSFQTLRQTVFNEIDFEQASLKNPNLNQESIRSLFDYGINPAYSDDNSQIGNLMLSAISNTTKLRAVPSPVVVISAIGTRIIATFRSDRSVPFRSTSPGELSVSSDAF